MAEIKLIATDLDGTFLGAGSSIIEENVKAVKAARDKGIMVVACSARLWALGRHLVEKCGFNDLAILGGGATLVDSPTGKLLYRKGFDAENYEGLLRAAISFGSMVQSWNHDFIGLYGPTMGEWGLNNVKQYSDDKSAMHCEVRLYDTIDGMVAACKNSANQLLLFPGKGYVDAVREAMLKVCEVEVTSSSPMVVDVTMPGVTKGEGLRMLAKHLGLQSENIMAIGDGLSDIGMLEFAGLKVAVGNADDSLKSIAQHVVAKNVNNGFAEAIYDLVLKA